MHVPSCSNVEKSKLRVKAYSPYRTVPKGFWLKGLGIRLKGLEIRISLVDKSRFSRKLSSLSLKRCFTHSTCLLRVLARTYYDNNSTLPKFENQGHMS
jgi:hypothetical protein